MPNKDRSFHEAPQKAGGEGWLYSEQQQNLVLPCRLPQVVRLALRASLSSFRANRMTFNHSSPAKTIDNQLSLQR